MSTVSYRTIWPQFKSGLIDYLFNRAGTEWGFMRLIGWFRYIMLLGFTVRFGISINKDPHHIPEVYDVIVPYVLWIYFAYTIYQQYLAEYHPKHFASPFSKIIQVTFDIVAIAFFYAAANNPDSDVFFFYLIPLIVVARYFSGWVVLLFALMTMLVTTVTWSLLFGSAIDFPLLIPDFWLLKLLSRLGFIAMLTVFYVVYQKRRSLVGHINRAEGELLQQFHQLSIGTFTVDTNLCLTGMNHVMYERHGAGLIGHRCQSVLCSSVVQLNHPCSECPLLLAIQHRQEVRPIPVQFTDRYGKQYNAQVSAQPIFDEQGQMQGALGLVYDLVQHEEFVGQLRSYCDDVERALDMFTQDERQRQLEKTRQLEAISRAAAAILAPEQPWAIDEITRAMASLLRCQWANIRLYRIDKEKGEGLYLDHTHGYQGEDLKEWHYIG